MILKTLTVVALTMMLSSCAWLSQNASDLGKGTVAVAAAPVVQAAIAGCVAGDQDAQAALQAPAEFFEVGYKVLTDKGADIPILTLVEESPDYYEAIPDQWDSIWAALDGKDCGPIVAQWRENSEAGFALVQNVVAKKDRLQGACTLYNSYAPIAAMFSPIPLPRKVPGCG